MWRVLSALWIAAALVGCAKKGATQLTLEQVPEALKKAFATALPPVRKTAESTGTLVAEKQYLAASLQLQVLAEKIDLTDEQRNVVGGATVAVNLALQELADAIEAPAEQGANSSATPSAPKVNQEEAAAAAAALQHHIRTK